MKLLQLVCSLILLALGGYIAAFELYAYPLQRDMREREKKEKLSPDIVQSHMARTRHAITLGFANPDTLKETAFAEIMLADGLSEEHGAKQGLYRSAVTHLEQALTQAPADTTGWMRLAYARMMASAEPNPDAIAAALTLSMKTGPNAPAILLPRLNLALYYWEGFSPAARKLVFEQINLAMRYKKQETLALAQESRFYEIIINAAQAETQEENF